MIDRRGFLGTLSAIAVAIGLKFPAMAGTRCSLAGSLFRPSDTQRLAMACTDRKVAVIGGNRSGCTTTAAIITARKMLEANADGSPRRVTIVGHDSMNLGQTVYRVLFQHWLYRLEDGSPAPPLVPSSVIDHRSICWENKRDRILKSLNVVRDGRHVSTVRFFSSKGLPKFHEDTADFIWICDGVYGKQSGESELVFDDACDSLSNSGQALWSSWPSVDYAWLAIRDDVTRFHLSIFENRSLSPKDVREFSHRMTPEEIRNRLYGEFVV